MANEQNPVAEQKAPEKVKTIKVINYFCSTYDDCPFKEKYVSHRCHAEYKTRQTCQYVTREDGKCWAQGSKTNKCMEQKVYEYTER
jgi:hypothetical protein